MRNVLVDQWRAPERRDNSKRGLREAVEERSDGAATYVVERQEQAFDDASK